MNENQISVAAEQARESARQTSGRFGEHTHELPDCDPLVAEADRPEAADTFGEDMFDASFGPVDSPDGSATWRHEDTLNKPVNQVWKLVDGDETNHVYAVPGYHAVNRTRRAPNAYIVTEKPWTDENSRHIYWNMSDEAN